MRVHSLGLNTESASRSTLALAASGLEGPSQEAQLPALRIALLHLSERGSVGLRGIRHSSRRIVRRVGWRNLVLDCCVAVEVIARGWAYSLELGASLDAVLACSNVLTINDTLKHLQRS